MWLKILAALCSVMMVFATGAAAQRLAPQEPSVGATPIEIPRIAPAPTPQGPPAVGATPIEIPRVAPNPRPQGPQPSTPSVGATPIEIPHVEGGTVTCVNGTVSGLDCICPPRWNRQTIDTGPEGAAYRCVPPPR